jgi:phosphoribosyl-AMP cyclohydrolase
VLAAAYDLWVSAFSRTLRQSDLDAVKFDSQGLVAAIVQDVANGDVLMMAWMNEQTLAQSLLEGRTVFWSRSRKEVWRKGDTSGDRQFIREAFYDCDGDTLLFKVEQEGNGACHTGARSCFYRAFEDGASPSEVVEAAKAAKAAGVTKQ